MRRLPLNAAAAAAIREYVFHLVAAALSTRRAGSFAPESAFPVSSTGATPTKS